MKEFDLETERMDRGFPPLKRPAGWQEHLERVALRDHFALAIAPAIAAGYFQAAINDDVEFTLNLGETVWAYTDMILAARGAATKGTDNATG